MGALLWSSNISSCVLPVILRRSLNSEESTPASTAFFIWRIYCAGTLPVPLLTFPCFSANLNWDYVGLDLKFIKSPVSKTSSTSFLSSFSFLVFAMSADFPTPFSYDFFVKAKY